MFDKKEYWARRKKGLRGQGEPLKPTRVIYPVGVATNRVLERARRFQTNHPGSKRGYRHRWPYGSLTLRRAHGRIVHIAASHP